MRRIGITVAMVSVLIWTSGCKCTRDEDTPDEPGSGSGASEVVGESIDRASDEAARAADERQAAMENKCTELIGAAWQKVSSTLRTVGAENVGEFEEEYRSRWQGTGEDCEALTDEQIQCVRAADDALFGLISCLPSVDVEEGVLRAPSIADQIRAAVNAQVGENDMFVRMNELPVGSWTSRTPDSQASLRVNDDGTAQFATSGEGSENVQVELAGRGNLKIIHSAERETELVFVRTDDTLFARGDGMIPAAVVDEDGRGAIADFGDAFAIFEANERSACTAIHASGATIESECRVTEQGERAEVQFRYRFPTATTADRRVDDHVFYIEDDILWGEGTRVWRK